MSLQVWLPFTDGTLKQQGLSSAAATNGGTVNLTNVGKLGKCATLGTAAGGITLPASTMTSFTKCSVAFWIKIISWNTSYATLFQAGLGSTAWNNYIFGILRNNANSNLCFTLTNSSSSSTNASYVSSNLEVDQWYHLAFVYNTGVCKIYINGVEDKSYNTSYVPNFAGITNISIGRCTNGSSYQTNCSLNDFRIYNHALSLMEVKRISQGLVLHYPLNREGWGQENLIVGTDDWSTWYKGSRWTSSNGVLTYSAGSVSWVDADSPCIPWTDINGKTITVSCELRSDDFNYTSGSGFSLCLVRKATEATQNYSNRRRECTPIHKTVNEITTNWTRYTHTYSNFSDANFTNTYNGGGGDWFGIYLWNYTDKSVQVRNIKLELGENATPWCPNSSDVLATTMGLNSTIEYDCSGFCNNGTRTGTFNWTSDTPKYSVSTHIGATNQKIHISNFPTSGFGNSYSFAWWGKNTTFSNKMFWGFSDGIRLNGMYSGVLWNTGDSGNNPLYKINTTTQVSAPSVNAWHHYVMVGNGTKCYVYLDGELWAEAKTYKAISGTSIYINGWGNTTDYCYDNMDMSDFRIYATALSADDVKALYEDSAYIDSSNNIYTAAYMEV